MHVTTSSSPASDALDGVEAAPASGVVPLRRCGVSGWAANDPPSRAQVEQRVRPSERRLAIELATRFAERFGPGNGDTGPSAPPRRRG